jgi:hypothetical protein
MKLVLKWGEKLFAIFSMVIVMVSEGSKIGVLSGMW